MITLSRTINIDAPVEHVFEYLTHPENFVEIWPSMVEVTNVQRQEDGRYNFDWVYKMAGVRFAGHSDTTTFEPNKRTVVKNARGIPSTFYWNFDPKADSTELTLKVEYELPQNLLAKLARPFLEKLNEHDARNMLDNLKIKLELSEAEKLAAE